MPDRQDGSDVLIARRLSKTYRAHPGSRARRHGIEAVAEVSLTIRTGAIVGLIGGSGCGKSTLGRCLAGLERPDAGEILYEGYDFLSLPPKEFRYRRRSIQMVFQDSAMSFNPWFSLEEIIAEPLRIAGAERRQQQERARVLLEQVGLPKTWLIRRATELSGGQRQRIAIARALAAEPKVIVLDEPFSGLDVPIQSQMLGLLEALRRETGAALLFISHDIGLAACITDEIAVMRNGRIVEHDQTEAILSAPRHPYTQSLLAAMPQRISDVQPSADCT